ncbi:MAG: M2 family metallopeptidase [Deltaproteobacteria bacterium]|nr:M2 family metallopeptidase [Deltaproteobacteria bacterium]
MRRKLGWTMVVAIAALGLTMCAKKEERRTIPSVPAPKPAHQAGTSTKPAPRTPAADPAKAALDDARKLVAQYTKAYAALEHASNLAWWRAYATGDKAAYAEKQKLELDIRKLQSDRKVFARIKALRSVGLIKDSILNRQLYLMELAFEENQIAPALLKRLVDESTQVEKIFNEFRGTIGGKQVSRNDIEDILVKSRSSRRRKAAWIAAKQVGPKVAPLLVKLIKHRNEAAHKLGFKNYYAMQLKINEQDPAEIKAIFDELDKLTAAPFKKAKARLDHFLARRYHVKVSALRPWHYEDPFFQEVPKLATVDMDRYFKKVDSLAMAKKFYKGLGFDVDTILAHSSLYPQKGKSQHAFCTDIDRSGDVRVLVNLQKNQKWASTLLHELGHGVYFEYIDRKLPFLLRQPAHIFTTEGIAMMFERVVNNPKWLVAMGIITARTASRLAKKLREARVLRGLVFARWSLVMVNFERRLYENPDQDINKLWWDLVEQYQLVHRPDGRNMPDWATKTHIAEAPAYYHNYMLGELYNSQLMDYLAKHVAATKVADPTMLTFLNMPEVGKYLKDKVFAPGAEWSWQEFVRRTTGAPLSSKAFAAQYVMP